MASLTTMKICFALSLFVLIQHAGAVCIDTVGAIGPCSDCSGDCYENNGCYCPNMEDLCLPTASLPCTLADLTWCCTTGLYYNSSASCCTDTPICVQECAPDEVCEKGKCVCDSSKYQNITISDFHPTLVCESQAITVTVDKCLLYTLGYDASTIHLKNASAECTFSIPNMLNNSSVIDLQAKVESDWCGNVVTADDSYIYVSNTAFIAAVSKPIITVNPISFNFSCAYKRDFQTNLLLANITSQTVNLPGINETGIYPVTMAPFKDVGMAQGYTADDEIVIGQDIFVGLLVQNVDGNTYVLRIQNCSASPTEMLDANAVVFISQGCPAKTDISTEVLENGNSTQARFRISSFQFQFYSTVYLTCNVRLCAISSETCSQQCGSVSGRLAARSNDDPTRAVKVSMKVKETFYTGSENHGTQKAGSWALLAGIHLTFLFMKVF